MSFKVSVKERMLRLICYILNIPDETPPAWAKEMMAYIQTQFEELKTQLAAMKTQMDAITALVQYCFITKLFYPVYFSFYVMNLIC
jgi:hypothetical protein